MPFDTPTTLPIPAVVVSWETPRWIEAAQTLAARLGLPLLPFPETPPQVLVLIYTDEGLELRNRRTPREGALRVVCGTGKTGFRLRRGGGEPLAKAVGIKAGARPSVLDATAGLGTDALVLAALGCRVTLVERNPVVAALLADGLERARHNPACATMMQENLPLTVMESCAYMTQARQQGLRHEVVCLDPMYPDRRGSALPRKEMRHLRLLAGEEQDGGELLHSARAYAQRRVVVKRPLHGVFLAQLPPHHSVQGSSTRFDVYLPFTEKEIA